MTAIGELAPLRATTQTDATRPEPGTGARRTGLPAPTRRLVRAAASEHRALLHHRERLAAKRRRLQGELQRVQTAVQAIDERLELLDRLTAEPDLTEQDLRQPAIALEPEREHLLHGHAIRETAVKVLLSQPQEIEALHYRGWYELVRQAGYSIAGADPLAAFLTQLTRSPVVRRSTGHGVYAVDRRAPARLRAELEGLHAELREIVAATSQPAELATARAPLRRLQLAIERRERALEEALRVLET